MWQAFNFKEGFLAPLFALPLQVSPICFWLPCEGRVFLPCFLIRIGQQAQPRRRWRIHSQTEAGRL